ncbi:MAG: hypothetical protein HZB26_21020 [Candidatus Hydrogenedentes bacterium]|nr:hypothetical protein [Candidatus Hydrogenedentota bacterium]
MQIQARGYILVETVVAMAVLSVSMVTIHNALGQASLAHAQARDMTQARFLLDQKMGEYTLKPALDEGENSGEFGPELSRFHWKVTVSKIVMPDAPPAAPNLLGLVGQQPLTPPVTFLGKIVVKVAWTTGGRPFEERLETLLAPSHLQETPPNAAPAST